MTTIRIASGLTGIFLLATTCHATISATGGYGAPASAVLIAIAVGVSVAAITITHVHSQGRTLLACLLALCLIAGELYGLILTGERIIQQRDVIQSSLRAANDLRSAAKARLDLVEGELASLSDRSPRLERADRGKRSADNAVAEQASLPGCRSNCRALLEQQVRAANLEVIEARREIDLKRSALVARQADAKAALDALPAPRSPTGLADRIGIAGWLLDLIAAALGSIAANGLAIGLLAVAGHNPSREYRVKQTAEPFTPKIPDPGPATRPLITANSPLSNDPIMAHAAAFGRDCLRPMEDEVALLAEVERRYQTWCEKQGAMPLPGNVIAPALAELCKASGIALGWREGEPALIGTLLT